jgi:hypothetical protein
MKHFNCIALGLGLASRRVDQRYRSCRRRLVRRCRRQWARSNETTPRPQIALFRSANELRGIEIDGGSQVDLR